MKTGLPLALVLLALANSAAADCIEGAARQFGTDADVLRAIAIVESHVRPHAVRNNRNGSTDRGLYQINSIHLRELATVGIVPADLHDVCLSSHVAALLLKRKMTRLGNTWRAVGAYHSTNLAKSNDYVAKVRKVYDGILKMRVNGSTLPARPPSPEERVVVAAVAPAQAVTRPPVATVGAVAEIP
jgi:soluble lytic murein transglycosylase-like protein